MFTSEYPAAPAYQPVVVDEVEPAAVVQVRFGARRALWIFGAYLATQVGGGLLVGVALAVVRVIQQGGRNTGPVVQPGSAIVIGLLGAVVGSVVAYHMTRDSFEVGEQGDFAQTLGWRGAASRQLAQAAVVGVLICLFNVLVILRFFPPSKAQMSSALLSAAMHGGWPRYTWAVLALVVAPTTEEFMFRGVLFAGLARAWSAPVAACVASLSFMLMHVTGLPPYWPALGAVLLLGAAAQVARIRSASLLPGVVMHAAYNACAVLAVFAQG